MDPGSYGKEGARCVGDYDRESYSCPRGWVQITGGRGLHPTSTFMERLHEEVGFELGSMEMVRFSQSEVGIGEEHGYTKGVS